jgi:hypothetical protein
MSALPRLLRCACVAVLLTFAACGGGGDSGSSGGDTAVPLFEFGFSGTTTGNVGVQVFFGPDQPTTVTGTFGFVNMNADGITGQLNYAGTWSGCTFSISIRPDTNGKPQAPIAASYNGQFKGNDAIQLTPPSGSNLPTLTLQRQGTGTRITGC